MASVRFIKTTKEKHLNRASYDANALYFCEDTQEIYKGQYPYTEGIKIIPTKADLPSCPCAADGVVYFISETKSGYMMSPDRTEWLQTIYAPVTDAYAIPEEEMYTTVTTVGAVRDIEKKIYDRIDAVEAGGSLSDLTPIDGTMNIVDAEDGKRSIGVAIASVEGNALVAVEGGLFVASNIAGEGIEIVDNTISVKLSNMAHGLVAVDGALTLNLATKDADGAMSKEDKALIDAIPDVYVARKYEICSRIDGTLIDYRDKEIRVMCPSDAEWMAQNSGENADANSYYIEFRAYAPAGAISFKEDLSEIISDNTMYYFDGEFAGIDACGRKYSTVWLPVARKTDGVWEYYGAKSTESKYIGWYYTVEWHSGAGKIVGTDTIRINLSNEACHNNIKSFYGLENDVSAEVAELQTAIAEMQDSYVWSEM